MTGRRFTAAASTRPAAGSGTIARQQACMFVKNSFEHDARVEREARALIQAGWEVTVIAACVPGVTPTREVREDGIRVIRVSKPGEFVWSLSRLLMSDAVEREQHLAVAEGREPDLEWARARARVHLDTTATPGADRPDVASSRSPALKLTAIAVRWLLNTFGRILLPLARPFRNRILDARMRAAGTAVDASVFHAHDLNTLGTAVSCASSTGAFVVYDSHELHTGLARSTACSRWRARRLEGRLIHRADVVITVSDGVADAIRDVHHIDRPIVVRNVPDLLGVEDEPIDLRRELGIPDDHLVIAYGGTVQIDRGIEATITALGHVDNCSMVVIGHGGLRPALEDQVRASGAPVHFVGPFDHRTYLRWLAGADVGTCCIVGRSRSYRFSLPNKLFEYWMVGLPVVASNLPDIERTVRAEQAGVICDPADPRSVAAAIEAVRADLVNLREHAALAGPKHHWGVDSAALVKIYEELRSS